jgi:hypothetical protein
MKASALSEDAKRSIKETVSCAAWELVRVICWAGAIYLGIQMATNAVRNMTNSGLDDSDRSSSERSGVTIRTDYGSGLQYLESRQGSLTPRLGADGRQMSIGAPAAP